MSGDSVARSSAIKYQATVGQEIDPLIQKGVSELNNQLQEISQTLIFLRYEIPGDIRPLEYYEAKVTEIKVNQASLARQLSEFQGSVKDSESTLAHARAKLEQTVIELDAASEEKLSDEPPLPALREKALELKRFIADDVEKAFSKALAPAGAKRTWADVLEEPDTSKGIDESAIEAEFSLRHKELLKLARESDQLVSKEPKRARKQAAPNVFDLQRNKGIQEGVISRIEAVKEEQLSEIKSVKSFLESLRKSLSRAEKECDSAKLFHQLTGQLPYLRGQLVEMIENVDSVHERSRSLVASEAPK